MKNIVVLILAFSFLQVNAQSSDPKLDKRLEEYIQLNRELNFAKLMDYVHPVLFKLAPKEALVEAMETGFNNEGMKITIDTIQSKNIGPVFKHEGAAYHKVDYFMVMSLEFKDKSAFEDSTFGTMMVEQLGIGFPGKKVYFDAKRSLFRVSGNDILIAIKDNEQAQWLFLGYDKEKAEMFSTLLPEQVISHFKLK